MTVLAQALAAFGMIVTFSATAGLISIKIAERICDEAMKQEEQERLITTEEEDLEKDYLIMKDGTLVEYNEEDQE
jgi:hypothetical protein